LCTVSIAVEQGIPYGEIPDPSPLSGNEDDGKGQDFTFSKCYQVLKYLSETNSVLSCHIWYGSREPKAIKSRIRRRTLHTLNSGHQFYAPGVGESGVVYGALYACQL
jgi:hypothetical protein